MRWRFNSGGGRWGGSLGFGWKTKVWRRGARIAQLSPAAASPTLPPPHPTHPPPNPTQISQLLARALTFFNLLDLATLDVMAGLKILNVDCLNVLDPPPDQKNVQFHVSLVLQNLKLSVVGALLGMSEVEKTVQFSFLIFARPSS